MPTQVSLRGHLIPGDGAGSCNPCSSSRASATSPFELALKNGSEQYSAVRSGDAPLNTGAGVYVPLPIAEGFSSVELLALRASAPVRLRINGEGARVVTAAAWPVAALAGTTLSLALDGVPLSVTFAIGDDTPAEAARRINAAAILAGLTQLPASLDGGQVAIVGLTRGPISTIGPFGGDAAPLLGLSAVGQVRGTGSELAVEGALVLQFPRAEGARRIEVSGSASLSVLAAGT